MKNKLLSAFKNPIFFCLLCFLLSRVIFLGSGYLVYNYHDELPAPAGYYDEYPYSIEEKSLSNLLFFYDSSHYFSIAQEGYKRQTTPFYPLYPLLIKLSGNTILSSIILSSLLFGVGLLGLYELGKEKAVLFACASPIGIVFSAVYSESLFFCLSAWFLYYIRERKLLVAGVLAGLGALSRSPGWILVAAIAVTGLTEYAEKRSSKALLPYFRVIIIAVAIGLAYPLYQAVIFGSPLTNSIVASEGFFRQLMPFWWGTYKDTLRVINGDSSALFILLNLAIGWTWIAGALKIPKYRISGLLYSLFILSFPIVNPNYMFATHSLVRYACAWPGAYLGLGEVFQTKRGTFVFVVFSTAIGILVSMLISMKAFLF